MNMAPVFAAMLLMIPILAIYFDHQQKMAALRAGLGVTDSDIEALQQKIETLEAERTRMNRRLENLETLMTSRVLDGHEPMPPLSEPEDADERMVERLANQIGI